MGSCISVQDDKSIDNKSDAVVPPEEAPIVRTRPSFGRQGSSLANLSDSRHVMMKRSSAKGAALQKDGSFYRPRQNHVLAALQQVEAEKQKAGSLETNGKTQTSEVSAY